METNLTAEMLSPYQAATQGSLLIWPAIGAMAALLFASFHFDSVAIKVIAMSLYVLGVFAAVGMQARKSGVQPSFGSMPTPLKTNMYRFVAGGTLIAIGGLAVSFASNFLLGGLVVGVALCAAGVLYHRRARRIVAGLVGSL